MTTPEGAPDPNVTFEFVEQWFEKAVAEASREGKRDSAALWRDGLAYLRYFQSSAKIAEASAEPPLCMCKDRPLSACPGEWEPGCDLGANEKHVRRAPPEPVAPERSAVRQFLIDYWTGDHDESLAHATIFAPSDYEAVRRTVEAFTQQIDYHRAQDGLLTQAQDQAAELASQLKSAKQPLHDQMAALNRRVIALTAENDRLNGTTTPPSAERASEPQRCTEADGCPTELAVLQRFWRAHQATPPQGAASSLPCEGKDPRGCWNVRCQLGNKCCRGEA